MHLDSLALLFAASINSGTALAIAALGLLINERAGVLNLGAEGLMLVAAIAGFATAVHTHSDVLALLAGAGAAALLSLVFAFLVIVINTNQYATGLALSLFGTGFSAFAGVSYTEQNLGQRAQFALPGLSKLPFFGPALFQFHPLVYAVLLLAFGLSWFLFRSKRGLVLRAVGESPESAHALGYSVRRIRMLAVVAGGALCGVAGAYISVIYTPLWVEGMIAGKGWIALALTTFATWRPARVLLGAYLFGGVTMLQLQLQGEGVNIPMPLLTIAAVRRDHRRARAHLAQSRLDPRQHAGVARQAVSSRRVTRTRRYSIHPSSISGAPMNLTSRRRFLQTVTAEPRFCRAFSAAARARPPRPPPPPSPSRRPRRPHRGEAGAAQGRVRVRRSRGRRGLDVRARSRAKRSAGGVRRQDRDLLRRERAGGRRRPSASFAT